MCGTDVSWHFTFALHALSCVKLLGSAIIGTRPGQIVVDKINEMTGKQTNGATIIQMMLSKIKTPVVLLGVTF